jgi:hypothetical protein
MGKSKVKTKTLSGCVFQEANINNPNEFIDLCEINNFYITQNVGMLPDNSPPYSCFRLKGEKT